jgi:hypothetical protein
MVDLTRGNDVLVAGCRQAPGWVPIGLSLARV